MANDSGLDDLEAELRRMEEELAALQGKKAQPKPRKEKKPEAPKAEAPAAAPALARKLKLPFGRKGADAAPAEAAAPAAPAAAPAADAAPASRATPAIASAAALDAEPAARAAAHVPQPEFLPPSGRWRQEGATWVLRRDAEPVVVRRVLDADGRVVREEAAPPELAPRAPFPEPQPEPEPDHAPRPLHALAERLGKRKEKRGWLGRKKD